MTQVETRNIDAPDETRKFQAHGHVDVVTLGSFTLGRGTLRTRLAVVQGRQADRGDRIMHDAAHGHLPVRADDGALRRR
jgi:hypothetical protein